jgi:hypothetical protein
MMAKQRTLTPLSGVVESVNDKGVRVGGEWRNFSKYAEGLPDFRQGQQVTLLMDGDFVMGVAGGLAAQSEAGGYRSGDTAPRPAGTSANDAAGGVSGLSRDVLIVRQSSLKAAIDLCAIVAQVNPDVAKTEAVLKVAASFESWVLRPAAQEGR